MARTAGKVLTTGQRCAAPFDPLVSHPNDVPGLRGGTRRHPQTSIGAPFTAAERLQDFQSPPESSSDHAHSPSHIAPSDRRLPHRQNPRRSVRGIAELGESQHTGFIGVLRTMTLGGLERQSGRAYGDAGQGSAPSHFLGFHLAVHLARHWGQVRTLRNLYCKTRGEPARFFPDNPSFPQ